jgi:hypothetical protein
MDNVADDETLATTLLDASTALTMKVWFDAVLVAELTGLITK